MTVTVGVGVVLDADDDVLAVTLPLTLLVTDVEGDTLVDDETDDVTLVLTDHDGVRDGDHDGDSVTVPELVGSALMAIDTVTVLL